MSNEGGEPGLTTSFTNCGFSRTTSQVNTSDSPSSAHILRQQPSMHFFSCFGIANKTKFLRRTESPSVTVTLDLLKLEGSMTRQTRYAQCLMRRKTEGGSVCTTSYIPEQFAKLGRTLRLRDQHGNWVGGWVVEFVGASLTDAADAPDHRKAIRNHRRATGDSQPRMKTR